MAVGLEQLLITNGFTSTVGFVGAWLLLRGKHVDATADERVAEINAGPDFAVQLAAALDRLDQERQLVAQLRIDLAQVTAERNVLGDQVLKLSVRLDETTARLGELNEQFSALARSVQTQITPTP
jgi:vacuolar-type H+-ATPase subunit I/STV1